MCFVSLQQLKDAYDLVVRDVLLHSEHSDHQAYELDGLHRLHLHNVFTTPNRISYTREAKRLSVLTGLHVHIQQFPIKDMHKLFNYVHKEDHLCPEVKELESEEYYLTRRFNSQPLYVLPPSSVAQRDRRESHLLSL